MDQAERGIGQHPHFNLLACQGFVEGAVARDRDRWRRLRLAGTPIPSERCLRSGSGKEVLRIEVRVADDAHRAGHFRDGFPGHLEQAGAEVARDAVVGNSPFQALFQDRLVESATAAGMASEYWAGLKNSERRRGSLRGLAGRPATAASGSGSSSNLDAPRLNSETAHHSSPASGGRWGTLSRIARNASGLARSARVRR